MTCSTWPVQTLRSLPLLASLTQTELTWLLPSIKRQRYEARVCILRAGDTPEGIYIIVTGRVQVVHEDDEGHALVADLFGTGELFGEMGLIEATDCPANVVAAEDCEVAFIPRTSLLECLDANPTAAMTLLRISLERLCRAHRQMRNLALTTVYTRVAQVLTANGHEDNGEWHVDVGSQQIAAMVGSSREMVSRVLRCMIEKRLVRRLKRTLIVIHRDALRVPTA